MTWRAAIPEWVAPSPQEVDDAHWLAYRGHAESQSGRHAGVCAALSWVRGGRVGPVTERDEQPVTAALAKAEWWAASAAATPEVAPPPLEQVCAELGVAYWAPLSCGREWAHGAWLTLRWLLGMRDVRGRVDPPVEVPARDSDGGILTADQLYEQAMRAAPYLFELPEQRRALRIRVEADARRSLRLTGLIEDTKRTLTAGS